MTDPVFSFIDINPFGLSDVGGSASPIFADIDSDGDLDGFIGNLDSNILFYKNTGTINNPIFATSVNNPFGLNTGGSNPDFVDIDGDGDLDVFSGKYDGTTLFYRNTGTVTHPVFAAAVTNPFGLNTIGSLGNTTLVDIDGDGDLDAFAGNYDGDMLFFKNTGTANNPIFTAPQTNAFGLENINRYGANPAFIDIDGDGDLDVFIGKGHYTGDDSLRFFRNIGTSSNPLFYLDSTNPFGLGDAGGYTNPTFADIDSDGDKDAFVGNSSGNTVFFRNIGKGITPRFSSDDSFDFNDVSYFSDPTFVDIDGDGDLDAFVGIGFSYSGNSDGNTLFFRNTGTAKNPVFAPSVTNPFGLTDAGNFASPTFIDIDNDGDLDAFIGNDLGNLLFYRNTGTNGNPIFSASISNPFGLVDVGYYATPTFVDIDHDNDLDAFVNNLFFKNTGTASNPVFATPQTNAFGLSGFNPVFIDIDHDGDLDALTDATHFFRNTGTVSNPIFSDGGFGSFGLPAGFYRSDIDTLTFADIDGDGDLDAYLTGIYQYGSISPWEFLYINNNAPGSTNLTAAEVYTKNTPLNLTDIVVSDPDSATITATLTLSNAAAGKLSTATSGTVTSTYNAATGMWKASGAIESINALLAGVVFTPTTNFTGAFTINTSITDNVAPALTGSKDFTVMLVSTPGNNVLTGTSSGNNTVTYASSAGSVTVSLKISTQQNTMGAGLDTLIGIENLIGSAFADNLTGNSTYNILDGKAGNDCLRGWLGADTLIGGLGNDTFFVENTRDVVIEKPNEGIDAVSSSITYILPANVEKLTLTGTNAINGTGNDLANVLTGNSAANQLNGQVGNDTLNGGGGNDTLIGWSGADSMIGGVGNDTYFVENAGDVVTENANQGTDAVSSRLTYTLPAHVENLSLTGTSTINGTGNGLANAITGNSTANQLNGLGGNDRVTGGAGNDILNGGVGMDTLTGGIGNDIFRFTTTGQSDKITDYSVANDTVQLDNGVFTALTVTGTLAAGQFRIGAQAIDANDHIIYNNTTGALFYDANGNAAGGAVQIATLSAGLGLTNADIVVI